MKSIIRDKSLAASGKQKIEWAKRNMPLMNRLEKEFTEKMPFKGIKITMSIHLEAKTAYFAKVLAAAGGELAVTGSNPLSTQDDVAAALADEGITTFAWHNASDAEYSGHIEAALKHKPNVVIDDGGDLVNMLHTKRIDLIDDVYGGCEETTTGVMRLRAMEKSDSLKFPMIAVNNTFCKYLFDNRYGTGQSVWDGINRTTNLVVAGKSVVVAGYGWCGKGVCMRAKGLGARVIVTEVNAVRAIEAVMDGFEVMTMDKAALTGDIFITVTGCSRIIYSDHYKLMKDGAIMCNAGHFDCEVNIPELEELAVETAVQRNNIVGYKMPDGRWLYVLGEGRLVNLACGDGHPAEIMDMSFALQTLSAKYILDNHNKLHKKVYDVPSDIDNRVAEMKLSAWNISIDKLTSEQERYINSWR